MYFNSLAAIMLSHKTSLSLVGFDFIFYLKKKRLSGMIFKRAGWSSSFVDFMNLLEKKSFV